MAQIAYAFIRHVRSQTKYTQNIKIEEKNIERNEISLNNRFSVLSEIENPETQPPETPLVQSRIPTAQTRNPRKKIERK